MYCPRCKNMFRITNEQVGVDANGFPVFHRFAWCDTCRTQMDLDAQMQYQPNLNQNNTKKNDKKKDSPLSIAAAVLGFFSITSFIGILVGIADLIVGHKDGKRHIGSWFAIVFGGIVFFMTFQPKTDSSSRNNDVAVQETPETTVQFIDDEEPIRMAASIMGVSDTTTTYDPGIITARSYKDMKLGDIGVKDNVYVGLSYVKRMSYLPTALGKNDDIGSGNEVILAFFDFYNNNDEKKTVSPANITCYVDGTQVEDVESYIKVECDGIKQYYYEDLQDRTQMVSVQDFEVPKDWNEIKFFYESDCVWTISQDDVKTEDFVFESMYDDLEKDYTPANEGDVLYSGDYEIVFQGLTEYTKESRISGDEALLVYKFTVNNTGADAIDFSLAGYNMAAYQGNYFLGNASYTLNDKVDGYSNIFNIDSIETGMSANIYVAFESFGKDGNALIFFDDGYITDSYKCTAYVER